MGGVLIASFLEFASFKRGSLCGQEKVYFLSFFDKESVVQKLPAFWQNWFRKVLKKLKKGFLKKVAGKAKPAKVGEKAAEEEAKPAEVGGKAAEVEAKPAEDGGKVEALKGQLVRVVDELSPYCGRVVEIVGHASGKVHGHIAWKDASNQFLEKQRSRQRLSSTRKTFCHWKKWRSQS